MCSVSLNVECVTNPLFFDTKLKDERSSIVDNGSGSPLIYRVFLPTFVQLPTEMRFGASPVPQIGWRKYFSTPWPLKLLNVDITFDFWFSKVTSALYPQKTIVIWQNICHGKIKLQ